MITRRLDRRATFDEESMKRSRLHDVITFSKKDARRIQTLHDDAVIVLTTIANYDVKRLLIDNGSSTDILFYLTFFRMKLSIDWLRKISTSLVGFTEDAVTVEGEIILPVTTGIEPQQSTIFITFTVVWVPSTYNAILGRSELNILRVIVSTHHLLVWFSTKNNVGEMHGDQQLTRRCFMISAQNNKPENSLSADKLDQRENQKSGELAEQLTSIPITKNLEQTIRIGS